MRRQRLRRLRMLGALFVVLLLAAGCDAESRVQQTGDNTLDVSQSADSVSGQSLAGAQVNGFVGSVAAVLDNTSFGAQADTGKADGDNEFDGNVGPLATATAFLGDALAEVIQVGDNELDLDQSAVATSGDAIAGAQLNGVVDDGDVTLVATNDADGPEAESGSADADNTATANVGPRATATAVGGDATARVNQTGDNSLDGSQSARAQSGSAIAGSQVNGVAGGGSVTIVAANNSSDAEARSGDANASNTFNGNVGPSASAGGEAPDQPPIPPSP